MKLMSRAVLFLLMFGSAILGAVFYGYTLSMLWQWFILPYFPALPNLNALVFVGIRAFFGVLSWDGKVWRPELEKEYSKDSIINALYKIGGIAFGCIIVLGLGYAWHLVLIHNG